MSTIVVYRVPGKQPRKQAQAKREAYVRAVSERDRFPRPELLAWLAADGFRQLPETPESAMRAYSEAWHERNIDNGFIVPGDEIGRKGEATRSAAESLRLWIKRFDGVLNPETVRVVCEG